jgi:hypothetical protein
MRLIDADELIKLREDVIAGRLNVGSEGDLVDLCPTIDAVPVVRCKDCKHFETPYCMLCKTRIGAGYWSHDMAYRKPDDFCSYGKRKDGEG